MPVTDQLLADESIVAETSKHWMAPVRDSLKPALLLIAALILRWLSPDDASGAVVGGVETIIGWVVIGLVIVGLAWMAYNIVVWRTASFAVTTLRVIREEGLISKRSSATLLKSITDVKTNVPFIGARLGYGDVAVLTQSGDAGADRLQTIVGPEAFRTQILEAKVGAEGTSSPALAAPTPASAAAADAPTATADAPASAPAAPDDVDTLTRLAELRDSGAITAEEYEATKAEILSRL